MAKCRWIYDLERSFDGELPHDHVAGHLAQCPECAARLAGLTALRNSLTVGREEIREPQFPAFFAGIRDRLEVPYRRRRIWALVSLAAAALIVAISTFLILSEGPQKVDATVVESYSTDLEGATITTYDSDDGVTTVWITVAQDDIL